MARWLTVGVATTTAIGLAGGLGRGQRGDAVLGGDGVELLRVGVVGADEVDAGHLATNAGVVAAEMAGSDDGGFEDRVIHGGAE